MPPRRGASSAADRRADGRWTSTTRARVRGRRCTCCVAGLGYQDAFQLQALLRLTQYAQCTGLSSVPFDLADVRVNPYNPVQVDEAKNSVVFQRYYHLFEREELVSLVEALPGARVVDCFHDKSNWCIIFERIAA
eukprot:365313-Chlamydomonas_euryale.AAC.44